MTPIDFRPLAGLQILDFSHVIAGPLATFFLVQLGARVIKVEAPEGGDVMRHTERGRASFLALNAGKDSITLDLRQPQDLARARALAAESHVLVDNLRPGALERLGLGYAGTRSLNPRLVYCAISGFGRTSGAWAQRPAYDHVVQAATGMALMAGHEGDPPIKTGFPVVDSATGLLAAFAILAAVREAEQQGTGCFLDVAMTGAAMQLMYTFATDALTHGETPPRTGNQGYSGSPAADMFQARDGWVALGANTPHQLLRLLKVLDLEAVAHDPAIFTPPLDPDNQPGFLRATDPLALKQRLREVIATWDSTALEQALIANNVPGAKLRTLGDFAQTALAEGAVPHCQLRDGDTAVTTPGLGFRVLR